MTAKDPLSVSYQVKEGKALVHKATMRKSSNEDLSGVSLGPRESNKRQSISYKNRSSHKKTNPISTTNQTMQGTFLNAKFVIKSAKHEDGQPAQASVMRTSSEFIPFTGSKSLSPA